MASKPQVVSTTEAAKILDVSTSTIRRMHKRGDLRGNLGKGLGRITVSSIEEWLGEPIRWPDDDPTWSDGHAILPADKETPDE